MAVASALCADWDLAGMRCRTSEAPGRLPLNSKWGKFGTNDDNCQT